MESKVADRITQLAAKWQGQTSWTFPFKAADNWRRYRDKANQDSATANRMQQDGQIGDMLEVFEHNAEAHDRLAENYHKQVIAAHRELTELANLLREHAPKLLQLVPVVNFFDPQPDDVSNWLTAMREIKSELLVLMDVEDDLLDYRLASKLNEGRFSTLAALGKWLKNEIPTEVIRRIEQPRRLYIHLSDWQRYWDEQDRTKLNALDSATIGNTIATIEAERERE